MVDPPSKRARAGPDLKIILDDGELEVHALILELASPVFASMLSSDMKEGSENLVRLPGKIKTEFQTFYKALQLYSMEALTPSTALSLAKWADEYQVEALKSKCDDFLLSQPVDAIALEHAVQYRLEKRTRQCLNEMKANIERHVDDLKVLTGSQEHLKEIWPLICSKAGFPKQITLPPSEHVDSMWSFVSAAISSRIKLQIKAERLQVLESEVRTWPGMLYHHVPAANKADEKASNWLSQRLRLNGLIM